MHTYNTHHSLHHTATRKFDMWRNELRKLQSVQNATARLITGTRRCDHITLVLRELHWLPIRERVKFKLACLVHQSLSGESPAYLADDRHLVLDSTCRSLRSADVPMCVVPRTYSSYGDRTFAAAGPRLWNSLPVQLRNPDISYGRFRRQLKGHLFGNDEHGALWPSICSAIEKRFTYLLTYLRVSEWWCVSVTLSKWWYFSLGWPTMTRDTNERRGWYWI